MKRHHLKYNLNPAHHEVVHHVHHDNIYKKKNIYPSKGSSSDTAGTSRQSVDIFSPTDDDDGVDQYLSNRIESLHVLKKIVPPNHEVSTEEKLRWLRSQIIGADAEFNTPFGKRRLTYADHTASGRSLHYVENYIQTNLLPFYGNSHTSDSYVGYQTTKMVHEASNYVKKCLGGNEQDAIIFCGSGSTAAIKRLQEVMGIAIPSILRERVLKYCLSNEERWVVFVGPYEHHSNLLSWRRSLAEVVEIGLDRDGLIDMNSLKKKLKYYKSKNRPIIGSFSACSNVTGICTDTRAIARLLHRFGAFACFDFAASGPYVGIDMRSGEMDGYDAIFMSIHKFVGGPGTPGVLLMNKALYRLLGTTGAPSTCGGGTVDFVNGFNEKDTLYVENIEEREDAGTPPIIQKIRAALAFWIKEYIGYKAIETREQIYIGRALERLIPNPLIKVLGNTTAKRQAILSFLIYSTSAAYSPSPTHKTVERKGLNMWKETRNYAKDKRLHGPFVAKLLNDLFGIQARGGCACAGPYGHSLLNVDESRSLAFRSAIKKGYAGIKPGWTRVSFPYYMSEGEFEFIIAAMEFIANYGQRFLPLYHFSWRTGSWKFNKNASILTKDYNNNTTSLATIIKALTSELDDDDDDDENVRIHATASCRYIRYLDTAKRLASLLPKFPPPRRIPQDIDIDLVPFRI